MSNYKDLNFLLNCDLHGERHLQERVIHSIVVENVPDPSKPTREGIYNDEWAVLKNSVTGRKANNHDHELKLNKLSSDIFEAFFFKPAVPIVSEF